MGPAGPPGPAGPAGASGSGGGGLHGMQEFTSSGTFTVPTGVTSILVDMWGASGGFSNVCAPSSSNNFSCPAGSIDAQGGPGSGAYSAGVFAVASGVQYTVTVGQAGKDGQSQIVAPDGSVIVYANSGQAGTLDPLTFNVSPQCIGGTDIGASEASPVSLAGGAGGAVDPNAPVSRAGNTGSPGSSCANNNCQQCNCSCAINLPGCLPACDSCCSAYPGTNGGTGATTGGLVNPPSGTSTNQGYVLIIW